jgi:prepilin-type N-terminal cleavage/methylation domain-containing protein
MIRTRGFTLIEMAIVLVIITLMIGGLAVPLAAQIQARRIAETNKTLEEAKEALIGYAMTHKVMVDHDSDPATPALARPYLPCPDKDGVGVGRGVEDRELSGACTVDAGWLPWVTLGTAAQDAWGNRLEYATQPGVTNANTADLGIETGIHNGTLKLPPTPPASQSDWYVVCTSETPATCQSDPMIGVTADIATHLPVVVLSRGANGWGARNVNGNTLAAPTSAHEVANNQVDNRYVSRPPSKPDEAAGEFDDLVTWLSFNLLITRVCPAGGCP